MSRRVIITLVSLFAAVALAAIGVVASGAHFYTVMTPSMGQTAPVGTLVVAFPQSSYAVGEIVTYERNGRSYTHRIISANADGTVITKGDLNSTPDALPVAESEIVGRAGWILPGMGWLWQGLPWLIVGGILVYLLSLIRHFERSWRWVVRISGWTLVATLVAIWLRPWVSLSMLGYTPAIGGGVDMHVVNTGLFPLDVLGHRLVSGQDDVVLVTQTDGDGHYILTPGLAFHWWEQVGIYLLCLVPMALSFLIRDEPAAAPARALIEDEDPELADDPNTLAGEEPAELASASLTTTDGAADDDPAADDAAATEAKLHRRRLLLIGALIVAILVGVAVVTFNTTTSALTAKVTNTVNRAASRTYFSCRNAVLNTSSPRPYLAWAASTAANTTSAVLPASPTNQTDLSGNNRTGRYSSSTSTRTIAVDSSSTGYGCKRDTPLASAVFTGTTGGYCLFQYGNVTSPNNPQTFSVEAWFKTSTKGGSTTGKIIGFGSAQGTAGDSTYDRHLYIDANGRLVFGVYPNSTINVKIVYTSAATYADGNWHHAVGTLSSSGMALYVDGALASSDTGVTAAESYTTGGGFWKVGCGNLSGWRNGGSSTNDFNGGSYFNGQIQYAAVYGVALNAAQVQEHYQAGVG